MWYTAVIPVLRRKRQEDLSSRPALVVYQVQDKTDLHETVSKNKILQKAEPKGSVIKITYCFIRGNWTEFRSQIHIGWFTNASKFSFQGFNTPFWPPWILENTCMDRQTDRHIQIINES